MRFQVQGTRTMACPVRTASHNYWMSRSWQLPLFSTQWSLCVGHNSRACNVTKTTTTKKQMEAGERRALCIQASSDTMLMLWELKTTLHSAEYLSTSTSTPPPTWILLPTHSAPTEETAPLAATASGKRGGRGETGEEGGKRRACPVRRGRSPLWACSYKRAYACALAIKPGAAAGAQTVSAL